MAISYENIRVDGAISFQHITYFDFKVGANDHGIAHIRGIADSTLIIDELRQQLDHSSITVYYVGEKGESENHVIFSGIVSCVTVGEENQFYTVAIQAKTATVLLDQGKRNRSFQDLTMTYADVVTAVLADVGAAVIFTKGADTKIPHPLFQYDETDWMFTKRMISHFSSCLIPDYQGVAKRLYFGERTHGKPILFDDLCYTVCFGEKYFTLHSNDQKKEDYLSYTVKGQSLYSLGDYCVLNGKMQFIHEIFGVLKDGVLTFSYQVGSFAICQVKKFYNEKLRGASLTGTVVKTSGEMVEMQLDIDSTKEATHPFQWVPVSGNLMYLMPQHGTKASLYFASANDASAIATDSPRTNSPFTKPNGNNAAPSHESLSPSQAAPMSNPDHKQLSTEHGKQINVTPSEISFLTGALSLMMDDAEGLSFDSDAKIQISAEQEIELLSKKITIETPSEMILSKS